MVCADSEFMENPNHDNTVPRDSVWRPGPPPNEPPLILLVDDFEDALHIYGQYLTYRGYRVVVAKRYEASEESPAFGRLVC